LIRIADNSKQDLEFVLVTYSVELIPSLETNSHPSSQEIPHLLH